MQRHARGGVLSYPSTGRAFVRIRVVLVLAVLVAFMVVGCSSAPIPRVTVTPTTKPASSVPSYSLYPPAPPSTTTTTSTTVSPAAVAYWHAVADDYRSWWDWPRWRAVGLCEQSAVPGGRYDSNGDGIAWHGSSAGGEAGSGYPGGLGIMRAAWAQWRKVAGVSTVNGADASPADQIRVARVGAVHGMGGWSSWGNGCIVAKGGF